MDDPQGAEGLAFGAIALLAAHVRELLALVNGLNEIGRGVADDPEAGHEAIYEALLDLETSLVSFADTLPPVDLDEGTSH